jgi:hypothetical protein
MEDNRTKYRFIEPVIGYIIVYRTHVHGDKKSIRSARIVLV